MKLTKGKISKLYGKIKQTLKNYNKTKVPNNKSFRKNIHLDLKNKTLKNFKGGDDNKTNASVAASSDLANLENSEKDSSKRDKVPVPPKQEQEEEPVSKKVTTTESEPTKNSEKDTTSESVVPGTDPKPESEKDNVLEPAPATETEPEKDNISEGEVATEAQQKQEKDNISEGEVATEPEPEQEPKKDNVSEREVATEAEQKQEKDNVSEGEVATEAEQKQEKDNVSEQAPARETEPIIESKPVIPSTIDESVQESKPEVVSEQVTTATQENPVQENVSQELPPVETKNENLHATNFYSGSLPENVSNAAKTIIDYAVDSIADKLNNSNKLNNEYQNPENAFTDMANLFNRKGGKSRHAKKEKNKKTKKNLVKV